jgi:hypothetical protein
MNNETKLKLIENIETVLKDVMDEFIGKCVVNMETLERVRQHLLSSFVELPCADDDRFQFTVGKKPDEIVPANLYTALRMYLGFQAPVWDACKDGYWKTEDGTEFFWKDGETVMKLPVPLNSIEVTFEVSKDFEVHPQEPIQPQDGELFYCSNGNGTFIPREKGRHIDWDTAMTAWRERAGSFINHDCFLSIGLDHNEWLHGVPYTWNLAGSEGAEFSVYQFPGVPDSAVTECCNELKRNRDVVGRINKVRIKNMLDFNCPKHTPIA